MGWATAIPAAISIGTSLLGHNEANKAAKAQQQGAQGSMDWIKSVYGNSQQNFAPYLQAGQNGLNALAGGYEASPFYAYQKQEMTDGLNAQHAALGSLYSGGTNIDLARHINGLAAGDQNQWYGQQLGLAQLGAQSATALGGIGSGTFNGVQSAYGGIADAAGQRAGANANMYGQLGGVLGGALSGLGGGGSSSYGGGSNASQFGLPAPGTNALGTGWRW